MRRTVGVEDEMISVLVVTIMVIATLAVAIGAADEGARTTAAMTTIGDDGQPPDGGQSSDGTGDCPWYLHDHVQAHADLNRVVSWSRDDAYVATGGNENDRTVKVWDSETLVKVKTLPGDNSWGTQYIDWSPDGTLMLATGYDGLFRIWSTADWSLVTSFRAHGAWVKTTRFSPDGQLVASAATDGKVKIWSTQTWDNIKVLTGHTHWIYGLTWSPDGRYIATSARDYTTRIWDTATWSTVRVFTGSHAFAVDWSPEGDLLAISTYPDYGVRVHHTSDWSEAGWIDLEAAPHVVQWSCDQQRLLVSNVDGVRVYRTADWGLEQMIKGSSSNVHWMEMSHDSEWIAICYLDGQLEMWGFDDTPPVVKITFPEEGDENVFYGPVMLEYTATDDVDEDLDVVMEPPGVNGLYTELGYYRVTVAATDDAGNSGLDEIEFSIQADLDVPYYNQEETYWCTLNSASMVLSYYGHDIHPWDLAEVFEKGHHEGLDWQKDGLVDYLETDLGLSVDTRTDELDKEWICAHLAVGSPVMFSFWHPTPTPSLGHSVVITGYYETDQGKEYFLVNDPGESNWEYPEIGRPWGMAIFDQDLYDHTYYHAIGGFSVPKISAVSMRMDNAMNLRTQWEGGVVDHRSFLDEGIKWKDAATCQLVDVPLAFGDATLSFPGTIASNHHEEGMIFDVTLSVVRDGGSNGDASRDWEMSKELGYGIPKHQKAYIGTDFDLSNLQTGTYTLTIEVGSTGIYSNEYITDITFDYDVPPEAIVTGDDSLIVGEAGDFDGTLSSDDGYVQAYAWDFGDGTGIGYGMWPSATHSYSTEGTYTVTLYVKDDLGVVTTDSMTVTVLTPAQAIDDLIDIVEDMNLDNGIDNSLDSKLENARNALDSLKSNDGQDAINKLEAFINEVEAQSGKKLTEEQANDLIDYVERIIDSI